MNNILSINNMVIQPKALNSLSYEDIAVGRGCDAAAKGRDGTQDVCLALATLFAISNL